jgi:peroxiredoxin Q/BCP
MALAIGTKIPEVAGLLPDGTEWRTGATRGRPLVLYFYPKDFTPGCTREACSFRDAREELVGMFGAEVVGVSRDSPESHQRFIDRHSLPFTLVADPSGEITRAFDATLLGGLLPISKRITYVVDSNGVIRGVFNHALAVERHVEDVKACLSSFAAQTPPA